jgi:hypothetical protein
VDRRSDKHGPRQDDQLKHETEGLVRSGHSTHAEEWKETEPTAPNDYEDPRRPGTPAGMTPHEVDLRAELTTTLTSDEFPADREAVLRGLREKDVSPDLLRLVDERAGDRTYEDVTDLLYELNLVEARSEEARKS